MAEGDDSDKTEEPTERKLQKAYEKGDVPRSMEFSTFFLLAGVTLILYIGQGPLSQGMAIALRNMLDHLHSFQLAPGGMVYFYEALKSIAFYIIAPMLGLVFFAIAGAMLQHRMIWSAESMAPKLERISPLAGFKRLFGLDAWVMFFKGILKVSIVSVAVMIVLWPERQSLQRTLDLSVAATTQHIGALIIKVFMAVLVAYAFVAIADMIYQRVRWYKRQKMTHQELKEELKDTDGNPEIKAKIRSIRVQRARKRMMQNVPKATVVVMNPTHYAVALKYEPEMDAPVCVAKGLDRVALKIRELAEEHRVAVVENPPLARALYKDVEIDEAIPPDHYKAVAEVIGTVMRIMQRRAV